MSGGRPRVRVCACVGGSSPTASVAFTLNWTGQFCLHPPGLCELTWGWPLQSSRRGGGAGGRDREREALAEGNGSPGPLPPLGDAALRVGGDVMGSYFNKGRRSSSFLICKDSARCSRRPRPGPPLARSAPFCLLPLSRVKEPRSHQAQTQRDGSREGPAAPALPATTQGPLLLRWLACLKGDSGLWLWED